MINTPSMQDLLEAGVHFGHQVRRGHPKMEEYIYGVKDGVHVINLEYSEKLLKCAAEFVYNLGKEGKVLLFVGTKKQAQPIIEEVAKRVHAPYVTFRWIGGSLTNFEEIRRNVRHLLELKEKKSKGELNRYTKKEQLLISRKIEKFERESGGLANLDKVPDAVFLVDSVTEKTALAESIRIGLPIVAITDTNANPLLVDYPIPGNDDATKSIKILTETIAKAYEEGLKSAGKEQAAMEAKAVAKEKKATKKVVDQEVVSAVAEEVAQAEEAVEKETVEESKRVV